MRVRLLAFFILLLTACALPKQTSEPSETCTLAATPTVLMSKGLAHEPGGVLLQTWELPDNPSLWTHARPTQAGYADFLLRLEHQPTSTDPLALLSASPTPNNKVVIQASDKWLRPATCLEKFLIGYQHSRIDTFAMPTEFAAFVLRSTDGTRLRIYFYTANQDGIGRMTPLTEPVAADARSGWRVMVGLHSHVFHPGQPTLNGILGPSTADAGFNLSFGEQASMQEAWITNGLHTVRIPASAFGAFPEH